MKFLVAFLCLVVAVCGQKNGDSCTHTGVQASDDANCGVHANNMLCGTGGTCVCADVYDPSSTNHYTIAADGMSCNPK